MKFLLVVLIISSILGCKDIGQKRVDTNLTPEENQTMCIERIFEKDSVLGEIRNHASEKVSLSQSIINYTKELESLDYSNCPEKFVSSFHEHIEAWKMVTKVTDDYPSLRGELHDIFSELEKSKDSTQFKSLVKQVWDTWNLVEENAM
ncbi:MAG: hypothetical protein HKO81_05810 [Flavobacteriaceae bacterium]|nr:hypothetical protein [Flavobacteriaceae bacterium]